ncbi:hypothetical protein [Aliikangiella coralliicola]|uniref:Uncharacterized protein n=1 Tax=Aliikangiella coralliicola TaxID=2592383 RepID=A0A545UIT8_9GAMM|nr:hypothetical protein [Aliikangiella coralliicola]TQV89377.1 hypothetical protein FLL46_00395 [Aliikangiella coralliicola]
MNELTTSFVQQIPEEGYQLKMLKVFQLDNSHTQSEGAEALCWPMRVEHCRNYQPLVEDEALFYQFADLGLQPESHEILAFANQYGWLGNGESAIEAKSQCSDVVEVSSNIITAEFINDWRQQLRSFIPFLELWQAISGNDDAYLRKVIYWNPDSSSVAYGNPNVSSILIASMSMNVDLYTTLTPGDVVTPARVLLTRIINQRLREHCYPALLFNGMSYRDSYLGFRCDNLLGAIWLLFARSVANNSIHRRCAECAAPFIPSRSERGRKKRFCTDACKSKNYRKNKKRLH